MIRTVFGIFVTADFRWLHIPTVADVLFPEVPSTANTKADENEREGRWRQGGGYGADSLLSAITACKRQVGIGAA